MSLSKTTYDQFKVANPLASLKAAELREKAFENYLQKGLPTKTEEAFKFTSFKEVNEVEWALPSSEPTSLTHDEMVYISKTLPSEFYNLVFVNGVLNATLSDSEIHFEICDVEEEDLVFKEQHSEKSLIQLSQAFSAQKIKLVFEAGFVLDKPLQLVQVISAQSSTLVQPLVEIILEPRSEVKLVNHFLGLKTYSQNSHFLNIDLNLSVKKDAKLKFIQIDQQKETDFTAARITFNVDSYASVNVLHVCLGSSKSRFYSELSLVGEKAEAQLNAINLLASEQHCDHYTFIHHQKGHNQTQQHFKSILADKSHSVFRGRVRIAQDAQKANSEQLNNNLLISRAAQADSVPQLEIYADDVKAGHGSTVGQLNPEEIFYFLSRGINESTALKMLAKGYALELVYKLENDQLENFVFQLLQQKLEDIF